MGTIRRQLLLNTLKLFDLALMVVSFALGTVAATQARGWVGLEQFLSMRVKIGNFVIFSCMLLVWHLVFSVFGIYASRRLSGWRIPRQQRLPWGTTFQTAGTQWIGEKLRCTP